MVQRTLTLGRTMNRPRPFRDYRWDQVHCVRLGITSITRGFVNSEFSFRRKQSFLEANQMERVIRRSRKVRSFFPSRDTEVVSILFLFLNKGWLVISIYDWTILSPSMFKIH